MKLILRNNERTGAADVYDATTKECLKTFENGADALTWIESFDCETDIIRCPRPTLKGKTITINFKTDDDAEDWIAEYFTAFGYDIEYEDKGENHGDDMVNHPAHYEKGLRRGTVASQLDVSCRRNIFTELDARLRKE